MNIQKTALPAAVIPGGVATPEAIANVIHDKFVLWIPLYRQEQLWNRQGVMLSRQTLFNWLIYTTENYLKPKKQSLVEGLLHKGL